MRELTAGVYIHVSSIISPHPKLQERGNMQGIEKENIDLRIGKKILTYEERRIYRLTKKEQNMIYVLC